MTDTEGLEAMKARHMEELAEWRTRCDRAEADNASLVEVLRKVASGGGHDECVWCGNAPENHLPLCPIGLALSSTHPGDAQRERFTRAETALRDVEERLVDAGGSRDGTILEQLNAAVERMLQAEQECERLTTATSTLDAMRQLAERERDALHEERDAVVRDLVNTRANRDECNRQRRRLEDELLTAREEGRREGLEQAERLAYAVDSISRMRDSIHEALAATPAQEAQHRDEQEPECATCPYRADFETLCCKGPRTLPRQSAPQGTAALFATVRDAISLLGNDIGQRDVGEIALSALERRVGAMARELREHFAKVAEATGNAPLTGRQVAERLRAAALPALTSTPPVFTLEEVEEACLGVLTPTEVSIIVRRLRERAGGKL